MFDSSNRLVRTWYPGLIGLACHPFMFQVSCLLCTHKHKLFITLSFHPRPGIQGILLVWHVIPSCFRCFVFTCTHKHKLFITLSFHSRPGIQGLLVLHTIPSYFRCFVFTCTHTNTNRLSLHLSFGQASWRDGQAIWLTTL